MLGLALGGFWGECGPQAPAPRGPTHRTAGLGHRLARRESPAVLSGQGTHLSGGRLGRKRQGPNCLSRASWTGRKRAFPGHAEPSEVAARGGKTMSCPGVTMEAPVSSTCPVPSTLPSHHAIGTNGQPSPVPPRGPGTGPQLQGPCGHLRGQRGALEGLHCPRLTLRQWRVGTGFLQVGALEQQVWVPGVQHLGRGPRHPNEGLGRGSRLRGGGLAHSGPTAVAAGWAPMVHGGWPGLGRGCWAGRGRGRL